MSSFETVLDQFGCKRVLVVGDIKPIVVDPKGLDYARYRGATALTPNVGELAQALQRPVKNDEAAVRAGAQALADEVECEGVLVTRGERGMLIVSRDGEAASFDATARRVVDEAVEDCVAAWRRDGLTIGFTNGCFDLIHPGHVQLLCEARSRCDRLIVGLNSDASVKRLKGATRPVQPEAARSIVLAGLAFVDAVVQPLSPDGGIYR
jgi:cytidyltransferase-like protein